MIQPAHFGPLPDIARTPLRAVERRRAEKRIIAVLRRQLGASHPTVVAFVADRGRYDEDALRGIAEAHGVRV